MPPRPFILDRDTGVLAEAIFVVAEEVAPTFARAFTAKSKPNLDEVLPQIQLELCALYLHLFDRDAFQEAGEGAARNRFADSLFEAVSEKVGHKLGINAGHFTDFCNQCQIEYSRFKLGPSGQSLANTLFWEFGKKLGLKYEAYNPVAVQLFSLAAMDGYIALLRSCRSVSTKPDVSEAAPGPDFRSDLKAALRDSARPGAPAPPGWWVLPVLGIVASLFLLRFNIAFGAICLVLTSSFFGFSLMRAKRNRPSGTVSKR